MTNKTKWLTGTVVVLVILALILIFVPSGKSESVKMGIIVPLTGNAAELGKANLNAFEIAINEINQKGGINNKPIELIVEDNKGCDSKEGVTAMQKLVNIDNVQAVYSMCSNVALASHPVAEQGKVIHFSCASNPKVTNLGDYMFRICYSDDVTGKVAAKYLNEHYKGKTVAILNCDNDWCIGLKDAFKETFKSLGGEIVAEEQIKVGATDVRTELTKIKDKNPGVVYFLGYPQETVVAFKQAKELGLNVPFLGGDAWGDSNIAKESGDASKDKYFIVPASSYSKEFQQKMGGDVSLCAPEAYDIARILADTMNRVGTNTETVKNELYKLRNYKGESGTVGLDQNGDLLNPAFDIKTYKDGKMTDYELGVTA